MAMKINSSRRSMQRRVALFVVGIALLLAGAFGYVWFVEGWRPGQKVASVTEEPLKESGPPAHIEPQIPVRLKIATIDVDAPIVPVGVDTDGNMAAPQTTTDVGWYDKSAKLGNTRRAMLLDGHYGLNVPEVFRRLNELKTGDRIVAEGEAGGRATYRVVETERKHRNDVDMEKAFNYGENQESMSIITCIGNYDYAAQTYDDRYIVYAIRVQ